MATERVVSVKTFSAAFPTTADRRTLASAAILSKVFEVFKNLFLGNPFRFQRLAQILSKTSQEFAAQIDGEMFWIL